MQQNRLISFLQTFGIILVVVGHSFERGTLIHTWIYAFHMPLFMFISGYLLQYSQQNHHSSLAALPVFGSNGFLWKKAKRLLIPYVFISSLAFVPKALMSRMAMRPIDFSLMGYLDMLLYPGHNAIIFFWFLPTLFLIFLLVFGASKLTCLIKIRIPALLVVMLALLLYLWSPVQCIDIFHVKGVAWYLVYFVLGYYSCRYRIVDKLQSSWLIILTTHLSVALLLLPNFIWKHFFTSVNGIVMSICLAHLYVRRDYRFLDHLFGASFAIFLFSWFPQVFSRQIFLYITHAHWFVGSCLCIVTGIYVPLLLYRWIQRTKHTAVGKVICFLTGQ